MISVFFYSTKEKKSAKNKAPHNSCYFMSLSSYMPKFLGLILIKSYANGADIQNELCHENFVTFPNTEWIFCDKLLI